jgi:hypothetical protein
MHRIRGKLTFSNVVASIALFIALAGGTAYAASQLEKGSVGTRQLKKEAVTPNKLSKSAKQTLTGPAGPTGPAGASGAQGPKRRPGRAGTVSRNAPVGKDRDRDLGLRRAASELLPRNAGLLHFSAGQ